MERQSVVVSDPEILAGCGKTSFRQYRHLLAEFRD
jgi:hypothetical protein